MADITLINDQNQDQTLSGVSKIVTRGTDGDVEFSVGGAGGQKPDSVLHYEYIPLLDGKSAIALIGVSYTASPAVGVLSVDIPKTLNVMNFHPIGCLYCTVVNSDTGNVISVKSIEGYEFAAAELDENTVRYSYTFSITWSGGTSLRVKTNYCRLAINAVYAGVNISESEGKVILSGINAAGFLSDAWSPRMEPVNVFDFRQSTDVTIPTSFRNIDYLNAVYFPSGAVTFPGSGNLAFLSCANMQLLDYSLSTAVQPCPPGLYNSETSAVIRVPASLYDAWVADTYWGQHTSNIVAV